MRLKCDRHAVAQERADGCARDAANRGPGQLMRHKLQKGLGGSIASHTAPSLARAPRFAKSSGARSEAPTCAPASPVYLIVRQSSTFMRGPPASWALELVPLPG